MLKWNPTYKISLSAGWCSGNAIASHAKDPGSNLVWCLEIGRLDQSPSCVLEQLSLEVHTTNSLARRTNYTTVSSVFGQGMAEGCGKLDKHLKPSQDEERSTLVSVCSEIWTVTELSPRWAAKCWTMMLQMTRDGELKVTTEQDKQW